MNREKRTHIFNTLRERMPAPTTELEYGSPFELLVAVILSAQATDVLSLIHISEPTRPVGISRMPSSA